MIIVLTNIITIVSLTYSKCQLNSFGFAAGHIQIAQVPDRHEPDSDGEVNFSYLFKLLEELGYQDYIGCEYKPQREY